MWSFIVIGLDLKSMKSSWTLQLARQLARPRNPQVDMWNARESSNFIYSWITRKWLVSRANPQVTHKWLSIVEKFGSPAMPFLTLLYIPFFSTLYLYGKTYTPSSRESYSSLTENSLVVSSLPSPSLHTLGEDLSKHNLHTNCLLRLESVLIHWEALEFYHIYSRLGVVVQPSSVAGSKKLVKTRLYEVSW